MPEPDVVTTLFDEWAVRFARGEQPDAREYLRRAGEGAEELSTLIDAYLLRADPPEPGEDAIALAQAWIRGEPPLLEARRRRRLRVDDVVGELLGALSLKPHRREKVKRYYQQLETGLLEPARVDERVFDALARVLGVRARELASWRPPPVAGAPAYFRTEGVAARRTFSALDTEPEERDEVDELFAKLDRSANN
jgi:hypothetical protein